MMDIFILKILGAATVLGDAVLFGFCFTLPGIMIWLLVRVMTKTPKDLTDIK